MSEIEKMYKNAGVEPVYEDCCIITDKYLNYTTELSYEDLMDKECPHNQECTDECEYAYNKIVYPPFTAGKVIRLLEWEANRGIIDIKHSQKGYQIFTYIHTGNYGKSIIDAVANYFCVKWQDLTDAEKAQIKEILE